MFLFCATLNALQIGGTLTLSSIVNLGGLLFGVAGLTMGLPKVLLGVQEPDARPLRE